MKHEAYCDNCEESRLFVHKSNLKGYECESCGYVWKLPSERRKQKKRQVEKPNPMIVNRQ